MKRPDRYKKRWNGEKYVRTHRLIAEKALGRSIPPEIPIHHFNGGFDGPIVICQNQAYHFLLHIRTAAFIATGDVHNRICKFCGKYDKSENLKLQVDSNGTDIFFHSSCKKEYIKHLYDSTDAAPFCACGCKRHVRRNSNLGRISNKRWNKYLHGHN